MKLIIGLGNPGRSYAGTRHNVGFEVLERLAARRPPSRVREKFQGELAETDVDGQPVLLVRPLTYMNRSGQCVRLVRDYYRVPLDQLLVVCDDFNLPLAKLRFRPGGSSGGQKGLEDVIRQLGEEQFPRLRIGVGPLPPRRDGAAFVLSRFAPDERPRIDEAVERAARGAEDWVRQGIQFCMNQYNAG